MAQDIIMVKGDATIKIAPDFLEYYQKRGWQVQDKNKKISVAQETKKIIKELTKEKKE
tara:strand:+ start:920 stop:1093 length:174 start_codon:yes stop_codon:yes gene_type:complete